MTIDFTELAQKRRLIGLRPLIGGTFPESLDLLSSICHKLQAEIMAKGRHLKR